MIYKIKMECKFCGKSFKPQGIKSHESFCSLNPNKKMKEGKPCSKETRKKLSEKMKLAHKEGRHPGWKKVNQKKRSNSELLFLTLLRHYRFFERYEIIEQLPVKNYFLDFALIDLKCDIEIDGVQHIRTKKAIEHDKKRDKILLNEGWIIYRIAVKELQENTERVMNDLIFFLLSNEKIRKYNKKEILSKYQRSAPKYGSRKKYNEERIKQNKEKNKEKVLLLKESEIDFSKYGWVKEASKIIEISQQKVKNWMKRNMPDFYEEKCYKRKGSVA